MGGRAPSLMSQGPHRPPTSLPSFPATHLVFSQKREDFCFLLRVRPNSVSHQALNWSRTAAQRGKLQPLWVSLHQLRLGADDPTLLSCERQGRFFPPKDCSIKRDVFDLPPWLQNDHLLLLHFQMIILPNYHWKVNGYFQNWSQMFTVFFWCPQEDHVSRDPLVLRNERKTYCERPCVGFPLPAPQPPSVGRGAVENPQPRLSFCLCPGQIWGFIWFWIRKVSRVAVPFHYWNLISERELVSWRIRPLAADAPARGPGRPATRLPFFPEVRWN